MVIEKIFTYQLATYINSIGLLPVCQSGFPKDHATESLLIAVFLILMRHGLDPGFAGRLV